VVRLRLVLLFLRLWFGGLRLRLLLRYLIGFNFASRFRCRFTGGVIGGILRLLPPPLHLP